MRMNARARKFAKFVIFKDSRYGNLIEKLAEKSDNPSKKNAQVKGKIDKHYPFNCISKHAPLANSFSRDIQNKIQLPCGYLYGESWAALRKCWTGYKKAKSEEDRDNMLKYAKRIQKIQKELGLMTASFPNIGLIGDMFFLYDKDKEDELRTQYKYEKVVCDRFDVDNIGQLVAEGRAEMYNSITEYKRRQEEEYHNTFNQVFTQWAQSEATQEYLKASTRKWEHKSKLRNNLAQMQEELKEVRQERVALYKLRNKRTEKQTKRWGHLKERSESLRNDIVIAESELVSTNNVQLVKLDTGWKYVKEVIQDDYRRRKLYDYEPTYYMTDLSGHRLADYKEEADLGIKNDPLFYRLYLEDKEWEKIYSKIEPEPSESTS